MTEILEIFSSLLGEIDVTQITEIFNTLIEYLSTILSYFM